MSYHEIDENGRVDGAFDGVRLSVFAQYASNVVSIKGVLCVIKVVGAYERLAGPSYTPIWMEDFGGHLSSYMEVSIGHQQVAETECDVDVYSRNVRVNDLYKPHVPALSFQVESLGLGACCVETMPSQIISSDLVGGVF